MEDQTFLSAIFKCHLILFHILELIYIFGYAITKPVLSEVGNILFHLLDARSEVH